MPLESRSRMVSFRLTEEEYDRFRLLCVARGQNSVSEMIRAAVNDMLGQSNEPAAVATTELHVRLRTLESRLSELATAVVKIETRLPESDHADRVRIRPAFKASF